MAFSVPENWACIDDNIGEIEISQIKKSLLISLFEESQVDDSDDDDDDDDERLRSVIRSLEAEIHPNTSDHNSLVELQLDDHQGFYFQPSDSRNVDCPDHDLMSNDLDFSWIDYVVEIAPSVSPSDEITSWYMDTLLWR
ncbi:hypothetical protein ACSBR2_011725 [Camellia fascicularis]